MRKREPTAQISVHRLVAPLSRRTLKRSTNPAFRARVLALGVPRGHLHRATHASPGAGYVSPMPELPHVEGFRRTLRRAAGRTLERVDVLDGGVLRDVSAAELRARLDGAVLATPRRHGKHLVAPLRAPGRRHRSTEPSILFHFGMTGALTWVTDDSARHRHDRVVFVTDGGELRYRDMRKLQGIRLAGDDSAVDRVLARTGPDAASVTVEEFTERLAPTRRQLKAALMDQAVLAGLGNLLVDEILWRARLHPRTTTADLGDTDYRRLHARMMTTLRQASPTGRVPDHARRLTGRRDQPGGSCPPCGASLARGRVAGRATVWCPRCQPAQPTSRACSV